MDLSHKTIAITGAARGIGRAIALTLGRRGADLALIDRDPQALAATQVKRLAIAPEVREWFPKDTVEQNRKLVKLLRDVSDACANVTVDRETREMKDENEEVANACQAFKDAAKAAQPPSGEEETKVSDEPSKEPSTNPLTFPGVAPSAR